MKVQNKNFQLKQQKITQYLSYVNGEQHEIQMWFKRSYYKISPMTKKLIPHTLCRSIKFDFRYSNSKSNYFSISKIKQLIIKLVDTQKMNQPFSTPSHACLKALLFFFFGKC